MTIRPQDLREWRFRSAFRGASRWEVRELLGALAGDLESTFTEVERLRGELAAAGARLVAARDHDREATRLISRAETAGRLLREDAARRAAEATAGAEARTAAMLRELEAERDLLSGRITACLDHQRRIAGLLQGEVEGLEALLASEPAFAAPAAADSPLAGAAPIQPADRLDEDATFSAADVSQALAAITAFPHESGLDEQQLSAEDWRNLVAKTASAAGWPAAAPVAEAAAPAGRFRFAAGSRLFRFAAGSLRGRSTAMALAAAVIISALATPGSRSGSAETAVSPNGPAPANGAMSAVATPPAAAAAGHQDSTTAVAPDPPPAAATTRTVPPGTLRVTLEAIRPCWIRLTTNGRSEERVLKAGESITRDSTTDAIVRTGNAGALVVTVNGRMLPPLGREGEIATRRLTR